MSGEVNLYLFFFIADVSKTSGLRSQLDVQLNENKVVKEVRSNVIPCS